ncbi:DUF4221 family protein [Algoriphagus formosus]|uniref:DUF4221 domain-containing protein n=1 Tax=Algoriphagus formosus TaxID=2007308 RepID=A0A4R5UZC9_9BACT|nr:DUF4221 family protein [Algoriphagus aquimaris]TDK44783.1 DUF4221 domain-containing protein [Algoriphagus aquimaris]
MRALFNVLSIFILLSCQSKSEKKDATNLNFEVMGYDLAGAGHLIFDRPHHILNDTLFSFDSYQKTIIKTPLNGDKEQALSLNFSFDSEPYSFFYINSDSIIFSTGSMLFMTDDEGEQFHSVKLFENLEKIAYDVYTEYPFDGFSPHLFYDKNSKSILYYFAKKSQVERRKVFASVKINDGEWNSVNSYHPEEYRNVPLNYTTYPSLTWSPDGFSFIYSINPSIVKVDTITQIQSEHRIKSFEGEQVAEPQTNRGDWSSEYFENWVLTSPNYLKLIYDPFRKVYYRFSQAPLNKFPVNGEYYYDFLVENRELYLTVLDEDFRILLNHQLPRGQYDPTKSFVFSKGLWIPKDISIVPDEEKLYGDLFLIKF